MAERISNLLTVNQFAERAGISRSTVYQEIRRGRLPVRRFGSSGMIRIPESALDASPEAPPEAPKRSRKKVEVFDAVAAYKARKGIA